MRLNAHCRLSRLKPHLLVDIVLLCAALCLDWHRQPNCYLANRINCHTCLPTSTHCCCFRATPCEAVAKIRLCNSFSVAKLVTWEVGEVGCHRTGFGGSPVIRKTGKDQQQNERWVLEGVYSSVWLRKVISLRGLLSND